METITLAMPQTLSKTHVESILQRWAVVQGARDTPTQSSCEKIQDWGRLDALAHNRAQRGNGNGGGHLQSRHREARRLRTW